MSPDRRLPHSLPRDPKTLLQLTSLGFWQLCGWIREVVPGCTCAEFTMNVTVTGEAAA